MTYDADAARRYYQLHREEILAKMKTAYQEKHRERIAARLAAREQRAAEKEQRRSARPAPATNREAKRRYRERHPERVRDQSREASKLWRERHPGKNAEWQAMYRQCGVRWRATERAVWVEPIVPLVVYELADGVCALCGGDVPPDNYEVDHALSLAGGGLHAYDNVQLAHVSCNRRKGQQERYV